MKLPRGVPADRLIRVLVREGCRVIHQRGSHVKMRHDGPPVHTISILRHNPLKTGTLHAVLSEVAAMRSVNIESLRELLL